MRAVLVQETGGPDVLVVQDLPTPEPGPGELRVDVAAAGVNYIDVYYRTGAYPLQTPFIVGSEGAGVVSAVGDGVTGFQVGDHVAWAMVPGAGYAEQVIVPAGRAVPVPAGIDDETAGAIEDPGDDPEKAMQKKDTSEILRQCLTKLSAEHREIIDLVYYHEKSVEEVARIVGVPENTVKTRMFYARKRLGELLKAAGVERGWP